MELNVETLTLNDWCTSSNDQRWLIIEKDKRQSLGYCMKLNIHRLGYSCASSNDQRCQFGAPYIKLLLVDY